MGSGGLRPGTAAHPLYHWHIPKTAGSSLIKVLRDSYAVDEYAHPTYLEDWRPEIVTSGVSALSGHLGALPPAVWPGPLATFTVLREPAARAWSYWRYRRWRPASVPRRAVALPPTFAELADAGPAHWHVEEYQAHWLTSCPSPDPTAPDIRIRDGRVTDEALVALSGDALRDAAFRALEGIDVVGVTERMDDTLEALSRFLGRHLCPIARINENPNAEVLPVEEAAAVRRLSPIDTELWIAAGARLDEALRTLPPVPSRPLSRDRWHLTMDQGMVGTGWHDRVESPEVGWHRWTGPGTRSVVWPEVRFDGRVQVEIEIVSAVADDVVTGLVLEVQGRPIRHELRSGSPGVVVSGAAEVAGDRPATIGLHVERTARLTNPDGSESDPTALAVRSISVAQATSNGQ